MKPSVKIGDKVAYSVQFLSSIGESTGEIPALRGIVTDVKKLGQRTLVRGLWTDGEPFSAMDTALAVVGPNDRFCRC